MLVIRQRFANLAKNRFQGRVCSFLRDFAMVGYRILTVDGLNSGALGRLCAFLPAIYQVSPCKSLEVRNAELQRT